MTPLQLRRCRLFYDGHEHGSGECGDPLDGSHREAFEALAQFRDGNVLSGLPASLGPVFLGDAPDRKAETLIEVGTTAIEVEGEKLVVGRRITQLSQSKEATALVGEWRLYRFLVEGQLDYLHALAGLIINHVADLVLHHPRLPCAKPDSRYGKQIRRQLRPNANWLSPNLDSMVLVRRAAKATADSTMIRLADQLFRFFYQTEWQQALEIRHGNVHQLGRGYAPGLAQLPRSQVTMVGIGTTGRSYGGPDGPIDVAAEAQDGIERASAIATDCIRLLDRRLCALGQLCVDARRYLLDPPTRELDWTDKFVPSASQTDSSFPYTMRVKVADLSDALRVWQEQIGEEGTPGPCLMLGLEHGSASFLVQYQAPNFASAVEGTKGYLGGHGVNWLGVQPLHSW